MELSGCYRVKLKVNSKAFAILLLIAIISNIINADLVRIGIANALDIIANF